MSTESTFTIHTSDLAIAYPSEQVGEESPELISQVRGGISSQAVLIYVDGSSGKIIFDFEAKSPGDSRVNQFLAELTIPQADPITLFKELTTKLRELDNWELEQNSLNRITDIENIIQNIEDSNNSPEYLSNDGMKKSLDSVEELLDVEHPQLDLTGPSLEDTIFLLVKVAEWGCVTAEVANTGPTGVDDIDVAVYSGDYEKVKPITDYTSELFEVTQKNNVDLQEEASKIGESIGEDNENNESLSKTSTSDLWSYEPTKKLDIVNSQISAAFDWFMANAIILCGFLGLGGISGLVLFKAGLSNFLYPPFVVNVMFVSAIGVVMTIFWSLWGFLRMIHNILKQFWEERVPPYDYNVADSGIQLFPIDEANPNENMDVALLNSGLFIFIALISNVLIQRWRPAMIPWEDLAEGTAGYMVYQIKSIQFVRPTDVTLGYLRDAVNIIVDDPTSILFLSILPAIFLTGARKNILYIMRPKVENFDTNQGLVTIFIGFIGLIILVLVLLSIILTVFSY